MAGGMCYRMVFIMKAKKRMKNEKKVKNGHPKFTVKAYCPIK